MRMSRFWLVRLRGQEFGRPVSVVLFDSNAVEMTTVEHYMKFCELLARLTNRRASVRRALVEVDRGSVQFNHF